NEGLVSQERVTLTPFDWNVPQIVGLMGVDDDVDDGDQPYLVIADLADSADPRYEGLSTAPLTAVNQDDDTAGVRLFPHRTLITTEAGGEASFEVRLASQPLDDVTLHFMSTRESEGVLGQASVTFSTSSWQTPVTLLIRGVEDGVPD